MYKPEKFWNRFAKRYEKSPVTDETIYQEKLKRSRTYFTPNAEILEFGCGTGTTAVAHAPFVQHVHAIDVAEKMLDFGRAKAKAARVTNITFTCADINTFSGLNKNLDAILGLSILHLLADKDAIIAKVFDMLKPGGYFISSTVVMRKKRPVLNAVLGFGKAIGLLPLVRFFSADNLVQSLTNAGFEITEHWHPEKADSVFIVARKP